MKTMTDTKHTPKLEIVQCGQEAIVILAGLQDSSPEFKRTVAVNGGEGHIFEANRKKLPLIEAIVHAVNAHEDLLKAAKTVERQLHYWRVSGQPDLGAFTKAHDDLIEVIAKAEGK